MNGTVIKQALFIFCICALSRAAHAEKPEPTLADVSYGPHERNVLDFWRAESDSPTPLVIYIHGGGFTAGDKSHVSGDNIKTCLENGVSFASINYPFYKDITLQAILRDNIARAVQFLRYKAPEWNIDKTKVAVYGGSAGAGSSLWLAVHDDLADPEAEDPVLRESTRVSAAGAIATQATYDFPRWWKLFEGVMDKQNIKMWRMIMEPTVLAAYHLESKKELYSEEFKPVRRDLDMMGMMDAGDPPVFLITLAGEEKGGIKAGDILHHPRHSIAVKERCDKKGMECVLILSETPEEERISVMDFFFKYIKD